MIERLQHGAKQVVAAMERSRGSGIATAANQQSQVSEDISQNVQKIADKSQEVVGKVSATEKAFIQLATQCQKLQQQVGRFQV